MNCPVCNSMSYKDICPTCGYDLENELTINRLIDRIDYDELVKYNLQKRIMKENYQSLLRKEIVEEKTVLEEAEELYQLAKDYESKIKDNHENYYKAEHYYILAIEKGHIEAMVLLGMLYRNRKKNSKIEALKDYKKSADLFEKAANLGNTTAMLRLAESYLLYFGRIPSIKKALNLYQKAIDLGNMEASSDLSKKYRNGYGILRANDKKADEYDEDDDFW